jgi:ketosteroid isomerase-like protein
MNTCIDSKRIVYFILVFCLMISSCNRRIDDDSIMQVKAEIIKTEQEFAQMVKDSGISKAFATFAGDSGAILRGNRIIKGKEAIKAYYEKQTLREITLQWAPDYTDVSSAGDLGYTYGRYTFSAIDSTGDTVKSAGIFHTVWKKQVDGSWRYVWD